MRTTDTHVYFWPGALSNWHLGKPFAGSRAYAETVARLDGLGIQRPHDDALSSRLLRAATFVCGEQWMMACKAWLMDRSVLLARCDVAATPVEEGLRLALLAVAPAAGQPGHRLWSTPLAQVLRTGDPAAQKGIGRAITPYDDALWTAARVACVIGGTIARMEADAGARRVLLSTGDRVIVEGSPKDEIWGVGLKWNDDRILDRANWRGLNLLGEVHHVVRGLLAA